MNLIAKEPISLIIAGVGGQGNLLVSRLLGQAYLVLGLEPVETLRMLCALGYPRTIAITNVRPIHPLSVAAGEEEYPSWR